MTPTTTLAAGATELLQATAPDDQGQAGAKAGRLSEWAQSRKEY